MTFSIVFFSQGLSAHQEGVLFWPLELMADTLVLMAE